LQGYDNTRKHCAICQTTEKRYTNFIHQKAKQVKEVLQEQRIWHEDVTTRFQPQQGFEDLVFTSKTNRPIHESNIRSSIEYIVDRINAQNPTEKFERFTPHCLRHTFATNCIAKGMRPKTLQKLLGHNSLQMTMDLYCHVLDETLKEEMSIIAEMV
jgi:integrase